MPIVPSRRNVAIIMLPHSPLFAISASRQALPQSLPLAVSKNTDKTTFEPQPIVFIEIKKLARLLYVSSRN
jgi:hypothetical protein